MDHVAAIAREGILHHVAKGIEQKLQGEVIDRRSTVHPKNKGIRSTSWKGRIIIKLTEKVESEQGPNKARERDR